ncbi:MAG: hypothetical protein GY749_20080 [Desulfobacteraceae bacterium]|nr:hypothetical protein [Desulfobacteraceae bacterium]
MRRFHSYGPVDCDQHFCVERKQMIKFCFEQLIGVPDKCGHYFTIWAARQTGKTWLMRQVKQEIKTHFKDKFLVGTMSVQGVIMKDQDPPESFLSRIPLLIRETFSINTNTPENWETFKEFFSQNNGLFDRPVILFIDEFDSLPPKVTDQLITLFRDIYLKRENYLLHGMALIGVRAVLGIDSDRGSPFNIQRSLRVPNLTKQETQDLFRQYSDESSQTIEPRVIKAVFEATRGQPGLVSWFGELLTEKYNPGMKKNIDLPVWEDVYQAALQIEWNNTILNLIKKAKGPYINHVLELFSKSDIPFNIQAQWCSYLYLNGIIAEQISIDSKGKKTYTCRFASPFVQMCLYNTLTHDLVGDRTPILALDPLDDLSDVFEGPDINIPALLQRYKNYLARLKAKALTPWKDQPRRSDMHLTEAVGHFHLYAWLRQSVEYQCVISPEFPTGNGKVDLLIMCGEKTGIIEVKSFESLPKANAAKKQAAGYAKSLGLDKASIALFVPVEDESVLEKLSGTEQTDGVEVAVTAIGWI